MWYNFITSHLVSRWWKLNSTHKNQSTEGRKCKLLTQWVSKKMWCCVVGEETNIWFYQLSWHLATRAVFNRVSKVISSLSWFCISTLCDWLTKLAPLSQPMGIQTKTNRVLAARVFPRLAPVTCICFKFWLARCVVYICFDWPELLLWFWFYDTQMKTAVSYDRGKNGKTKSRRRPR